MDEGINVAVLVVGDLNRSPRMLNHCVALSEAYGDIKEISLIGFYDGDIRADIKNNEKIKIYNIFNYLDSIFRKLPRLFYIFVALFKIIMQILSLFFILLFKIPKFEFIIVQNPPGIPALFVCWIVCFIRKSKLIIDWHNYGYTILQVNKRPNFLCKIAKTYEKFFSGKSFLNFCVSSAEKRDLKEKFNIDAICIPDKPVKGLFKQVQTREEKEKLISKYPEALSSLKNNSILTLISSTSWTPDEDFSLLLDVFKETEIKIDEFLLKEKISNFKKILFLITGKGPNKKIFFDNVAKLNLKYFEIKSLWVDSDDYTKILSLCDLGISLHYSSSGIDLPMKVVDMFSAGIPVANVHYETIKELVEDGKNGFVFKDHKELSKILMSIIIEIVKNGKSLRLEKFKEYIKNTFNKSDWTAQWIQRVKDKIEKYLFKKQ